MSLDLNYASYPVLQKIHNLLPELSRTEQKVASYILENAEKVTSFTVADIADGSSASDATVVRTCKSLGFSSFQDFKVSMARNLAYPLRTSYSVINPDDTAEMVVDKIFKDNINTLQMTLNSCSAKKIEEAAELLRSAERILIFAIGESNAVAVDMQHKMMRLGLTGIAYTDNILQLMAGVIAKETDVVFAISHCGDSADVVEAARLCRARGAKVISMSSAPKSPLGKISDITLTTVSNETHFRINSISSRLAQFTLIDCLCNLIYLKMPQTEAVFGEIDEAMKRRRL